MGGGGRLKARAQPLLVDGDVVQHDLLVSQRRTHRLARVGLLGRATGAPPPAPVSVAPCTSGRSLASIRLTWLGLGLGLVLVLGLARMHHRQV